MTKTNMFSRGAAKRPRTSGLYASASILPLLFVSGPALAQNAPTPIPDVNVQAPPVPPNLSPADIGTASAASGGMYVPDQSFGPFGNLNAQDIPFATASIPQAVIQDTQAKGLNEITHYDPSVNSYYSSNTQQEAIAIRGFPVDFNVGYHQDGATISYSGAVQPELLERVDIYKGLDGFLYGFATPGGVVNYLTKKPLDEPLTRVTLSYTSRSAFEEAIDWSRRFGSGNQFGLRINLAHEYGDLPIQFQRVDRNLEAVSLDWKPTDTFKLWADFNHSFKDLHGIQEQFYQNFTTNSDGLVAVPPSLTRNYGQPWYNSYQETMTEKAGLEWKDNDWKANAVVAVSQNRSSYIGEFSGNLNSDGTYSGTPEKTPVQPYTDDSINASITRNFKYAFIDNDLTFGISQTWFYDQFGYNYAYGPDTAGSLNNPVYYPEPVWNIPNNGKFVYDLHFSNEFVQDKVMLGEKFGIIAGVGRPSFVSHEIVDKYHIDSFSSGRDWAPQFAVLFKPIPQITAYASYVESYQPGGLINDLAAQNNGAVLPPYTSKQNEIGIKAEVYPGLQIASDVFQIRQPAFYQKPTSTTTYIDTEEGEQRNQGIELNVTGKLTQDLRIYGGFMLIDSAFYNTGYPNGTDLRTGNARLFLEYALPWVPGLSFNGGVQHTGQQTITPDELFLRPYTIFSLGAKYETVVYGQRVVARLNATNITNLKYWDTPGSLGDPLTIKASLQMDLNWN